MTDDDSPTAMQRRIATVELADETVLEVRITNADTIRYEQQASREGWPVTTANRDGVISLNGSALQATYETWAALKRTGRYPHDFARFRDYDCVDVNVEEKEVPPTRPGPEPGSSQNSPGTDAAPSRNSPAPTMT